MKRREIAKQVVAVINGDIEMINKTDQELIATLKKNKTASPVPFFLRIGRILNKNGPLLLMASPGIVLLFVFAYIPMFGLVIAFKNYRAADGIFESKWIGLKNFEYLFSTSDAWRITSNTLFLNAIFIVTILVGAVGLALLLNEVRDGNKFLARFYQSALFFPYFMSWVIVSYFVYGFLNTDNGLLNHWLTGLGLAPVRWYAEPGYWPFILTIVNLWKNVGFWSIVYLSGMLAISPEYYPSSLCL
jgi:putative aldouronate transport system permease protein